MDKQADLLAMDFDGVIADSIMECAVVAYNGFARHKGFNNQIYTPKDIDPVELDIFKQTRPFIRSGEDYIYLYHAMNEGVKIGEQDDFDNFKNKYIDLKDLYYKLFCLARNRLLNDHYEEWISLSPLYNGMDTFLNSVLKKVHIISTKASRYIVSLLSHFDVRIDRVNIHSTENGQSKAQILLDIMDSKNISNQNTTYIDDHIDTLIGMQRTNANCLLATWGYNNKNLFNLVENTNIEMIGLKKFYKKYG